MKNHPMKGSRTIQGRAILNDVCNMAIRGGNFRNKMNQGNVFIRHKSPIIAIQVSPKTDYQFSLSLLLI